MIKVGVTVLLTDKETELLNTCAYKRELSPGLYLSWLVNRWTLEQYKMPKPAPVEIGYNRRTFKVPYQQHAYLHRHRSAFGSVVGLLRALVLDDARRLRMKLS